MRKLKYDIYRGNRVSPVLVCGSLSFEPLTGMIWTNKRKGKKRIRRNSKTRKILEELMEKQNEQISYERIWQITDVREFKHEDKSTKKFINDLIEALKRKLCSTGLSRNEVKSMFLCDDGYMMIDPKQGRKRSPK